MNDSSSDARVSAGTSPPPGIRHDFFNSGLASRSPTRDTQRHCMLRLSAQPMDSEGSRPNPKELGHVVLL